MALLLVLLVIGIVVYFFMMTKEDQIEGSHKNNKKKIPLNKLNYNMEASQELGEFKYNQDQITKKNNKNSQLLISNYWRRNLSKDDVEFARIPGDNNRININNINDYDYNDLEFWESFNKNKLVLMAKDPYWIYTYWNITGLETEKTEPIIRIYDITDNDDKNNFFDVNISPKSDNWYIKAPHNNRNYYGEIGLLTKDNIFISLAQSNSIFIPSNQPHEEFGQVWMRVIDGKKEYVKFKPKNSLEYTPEIVNQSSASLLEE